MTPLREVKVGSASLDRFRTVLTEEQWERLQRAAVRARRDFEGRVVWNVNSTARGGGVAELLASSCPTAAAPGWTSAGS
jgi:trehalose synthase